MMGTRFAVDDLEWEAPTAGPNHSKADDLAHSVREMLPALRSRRGEWAVLESFDTRSGPGFVIGLRRRDEFSDCEFTARYQSGEGSRLYVRFIGAKS